MLDRALIDRIIALHEMDELIGLARDLGLSREQTDVAHRDYLDALVRQAWADGRLTDAETADLLLVASLLGVGEAERQESVRAAAEGVGGRSGHACSRPVGAFALEPGDRVVFTGDAPGVSREQLCDEAERLGLLPMSSVSRKTKVVVASDPDSISGKARRARECSVPVVDFAAYFRLRDRIDRDPQ